MSKTPFVMDLTEAKDVSVVGGKALNLGELIRAGLPVPGGFVITTEAYRAAKASGGEMPPTLVEEIRDRYEKMSSPPVAARSSATAEDMAEASMAGQYETILDIADDDALLRGIAACWASLDTPRTRTYLKEHGIDMASVAMAVVVQQLVPADVAGVAFSANPKTGDRDQTVIEATWGLGDALVGGHVQPDVFTLGKEGGIVDQVIGDKDVWIPPGAGGPQPLDEARRGIPSITADDLQKVHALAGQCERHFGRPQDIEWAIHEGQLFLLQSRAITTLDQAAALDEVIVSNRAELKDLMAAGRGPWALHNIAETLSQPTPLTWSIVRRFMSGAGGFGEMYRMAGFAPSAKVCQTGFLKLIAGRPYMDCSLAPEMFFENYPFRYDVDLLKASPDAAQDPPTVPAGTLGQKLKGFRKIGRVTGQLRKLLANYDTELNERVFPAFVEYCRAEKRKDLASLSNEQLTACLRERERAVLDEFAPKSLLPSLLDGLAMEDLRGFLAENFWNEDPEELANNLAVSDQPDWTMRNSIDLYHVAAGDKTLEQWLADHGHRAPEEFDLASPRYRERPEEARRMADRLTGGADPAKIHHDRYQRARNELTRLQAALSSGAAEKLESLVKVVRRYMPFRENGKYYLILGYDLLRDVALEAGRRLKLRDDVFLLTGQELQDALAGRPVDAEAIDERKARRRAEASVSLAMVLDAEAIHTLGEPPTVADGARLDAFAVSSGGGSGPARIVLSPDAAGDLGHGYVLVCPSTDPSWTPLFVNAAGLVLERGGTLSHGAVVAREMGIPAVVVPNATKILTDGETVFVDGHRGALVRTDKGGDASAVEEAHADPNDVRIRPELTPPPPGVFERTMNKVRNAALIVWAVFLAGVFLLPAGWLNEPATHALDAMLWPLIPAVGHVWAVAVIAIGMAVALMGLQRVLTDNRRLIEGKRRLAELRKRNADLPDKCPRRQAISALSQQAQMRQLGATFVPLGLLLGPLVMIFLWFPGRVDPASWNVPAGSNVTISVAVDPSWQKPVRLKTEAPLSIDPLAKKERTAPPVRVTLERITQIQPDEAGFEFLPPDVQDLMRDKPEEVREALRTFLEAGVPPQGLTWPVLAEPDANGRFLVTAETQGASLSVPVILGNAAPPDMPEVAGDDGSPLRSIRVTYPRSEEKRTFWTPLAFTGIEKVKNWDAGWLGVYLVAYIPLMFILRFALKLP